MTRSFTLCIDLRTWARLFHSGMGGVNPPVSHPLFVSVGGGREVGGAAAVPAYGQEMRHVKKTAW